VQVPRWALQEPVRSRTVGKFGDKPGVEAQLGLVLPVIRTDVAQDEHTFQVGVKAWLPCVVVVIERKDVAKGFYDAQMKS
jgi:hypothetical protein